MSYDFELYTSCKHVIGPPTLGAGGQVVLEGPDLLEREDIPGGYLPIVGKKRVLWRIHLEADLTPADQDAVELWLRELVLATKSVLIDLQTERFETATKSGLIAASDAEAEGLGAMSFWFEDGEGFYRQGLADMLDLITQILPAALPNRYGEYEPLQGKVEGNDFAGLIAAFQADTDQILKAQTPFAHIYLSIPCKKTFAQYHPEHILHSKHLLGHVQFDLRPKLFADPAGFAALRALFEAVCVQLDVVYAEILQDDQNPTSWIWEGLPDNRPHTICVGSAYQAVWPGIAALGHKVGTHHRIIATDRFGNTPPMPPKDLLAPGQHNQAPGSRRDHALVFPFDVTGGA